MTSAFAVFITAGAGCIEEDVGTLRQAAIYGEVDNRVELLEHPDEAVRLLGQRSVMALVANGEIRNRWMGWDLCDETSISPANAPSLVEAQGLCETELFADQPYGSTCSGTLVDTNLVLTAAHCVPNDEACASLRIVGGYYYDAEDTLHPISRSEDVFACRAWYRDPGRDVALIELDRPVGDRYSPAPIAAVLPEVGNPSMIIGFPTGVPMKVADQCTTLRVDANAAYTNCDAVNGNSGSPFFNAAGEVVGVASLGPGAFRPRAPGECNVYTVYAEDGTLPGVTEVPQLQTGIFASLAIDVFCESGYPSPLCGIESTCGDGACNAAENPAACPADCPVPSCGDGICDPGEEFTCAAECGVRDRAAECGGGPDAGVPIDGGVANDGGMEIDAGVVDAGVGDAAIVIDGGMLADAGPVVPMPDPDGCGCSTTSNRGSGWFVALCLGHFVRRSRHQRRKLRS